MIQIPSLSLWEATKLIISVNAIDVSFVRLQFDSGGPMVYEDVVDEQFLVVGVVSAGYGCARKKFPGIYTNVRDFLPWIERTIDSN